MAACIVVINCSYSLSFSFQGELESQVSALRGMYYMCQGYVILLSLYVGTLVMAKENWVVLYEHNWLS